MAIDTKDKRSSAINHGSPWRGMWPAPDGTIAALADRQHIVWLYRGIVAATPIAGPFNVEASQAYIAGSRIGELYGPGSAAAQHRTGQSLAADWYTSSPAGGQGRPAGSQAGDSF